MSVTSSPANSCTRPTPLHVIAQSIPTGPSGPAGSAAFKIMRRTALGQRQSSGGETTPASSSVPSKATSEEGAENSDEGILSPVDGTPIKDRSKMTREEREASYKAARERIFGGFQTETMINEGISTGETSASMSRSSSSSGKKKVHRQRAPKDDSFEARSSYVPYHGMQIHPPPGQMTQYQEPQMMNNFPPGPMPSTGNYNTIAAQYGVDSPNGYASPVPFTSGGPQLFNGPEMWQGNPTISYNPYGHLSASPGQGLNQSPQTMYQMGMHNQYLSSNGLNYTQSMHNWPQAQYQTAYPAQPPQWSQFGAQSPNPPYQYGQLPAQAYANHATYSTQHPVPGSYSRSLFNPQTRSFVPGSSAGRSGAKNSRKKNNNSPGLARAGSSNHSGISEAASVGLPSKASSAMPPREDSLQQKYGAPPNLPKKPPPSQVSLSLIEGAAIPPPPPQAAQHRSSSAAPLVVNGASS